MQFITGLFGGSGNAVLTMILALGIVLVLIVIGLWLLKLISNVSGNAVRGRNRRLAVIDSLALDQKRQLLIVRRDNVEHLILTGGPQDVIVETGIPVVEAAAPQPARRTLPTPGMKKATAPAIQPVTSPAPEPAARPGRSLRHTGLLRPVDAPEPSLSGQNADISNEPPTDSAKQSRNDKASEGETVEHDSGDQANRH